MNELSGTSGNLTRTLNGFALAKVEEYEDMIDPTKMGSQIMLFL